MYDPDILLGHDMYGEMMDILLTRIDKHKIKASKLSRLCNLPAGYSKSGST